MSHIFPILTPIAVDPAHPFPFIPNLGLTMAVSMQRKSDGNGMSGLIPIPAQVDRFSRLRPEDSPKEDELRFIQLEELIGMFISGTLPGF